MKKLLTIAAMLYMTSCTTQVKEYPINIDDVVFKKIETGSSITSQVLDLTNSDYIVEIYSPDSNKTFTINKNYWDKISKGKSGKATLVENKYGSGLVEKTYYELK